MAGLGASLMPRGKESVCNAEDTVDAGLIPGSGRSPGGGNGHPLQYSCLGNPMIRGAWRATVKGVAKSGTRLSNWACIHTWAGGGLPKQPGESLLTIPVTSHFGRKLVTWCFYPILALSSPFPVETKWSALSLALPLSPEIPQRRFLKWLSSLSSGFSHIETGKGEDRRATSAVSEILFQSQEAWKMGFLWQNGCGSGGTQEENRNQTFLKKIYCQRPNGRGVGARMDTYISTAKSLCCPPASITTLLINYTPIYNQKFKYIYILSDLDYFIKLHNRLVTMMVVSDFQMKTKMSCITYSS